MLIADLVFCAALAAVIGLNLIYGPRIMADRIVMQWRLNGQPTRSATKPVALWWMVGFMIAVRAAIRAASTYVPDKVHGVEWGVVLFSLAAALSHAVVV
jgi:hypothetical protein